MVHWLVLLQGFLFSFFFLENLWRIIGRTQHNSNLTADGERKKSQSTQRRIIEGGISGCEWSELTALQGRMRIQTCRCKHAWTNIVHSGVQERSISTDESTSVSTWSFGHIAKLQLKKRSFVIMLLGSLQPCDISHMRHNQIFFYGSGFLLKDALMIWDPPLVPHREDENPFVLCFWKERIVCKYTKLHFVVTIIIISGGWQLLWGCFCETGQKF